MGVFTLLPLHRDGSVVLLENLVVDREIHVTEGWGRINVLLGQILLAQFKGLQEVTDEDIPCLRELDEPINSIQQWHDATKRKKHFQIYKVVKVSLCSSRDSVIWGWGHVQPHLHYQSFILW
jgi:hypothetical protein